MTRHFSFVLMVFLLFPLRAHAEKENIDYLKGITSIVVEETLGNTCAVLGFTEELQPSAILPAVQKIMAHTPGVAVMASENESKDDPNALTLHFTFSSYTETVGGESKGAGALTLQMTKKNGADIGGLPLALSMPFVLPDNCSDLQLKLADAAIQLVQYLPGYMSQARTAK